MDLIKREELVKHAVCIIKEVFDFYNYMCTDILSKLTNLVTILK